MTTRSGGSEHPVEHGNPSDATVKQLYGTAFACAKPKCRAWLYELDADTGRRTLNSRVAHIHARSEGGPRWDPDMPEMDNRGVDNLLLLCVLHAWQIDQVPDDYPAEMLRGWKRAQLADYDSTHRNWSIGAEEVQEAIAPLDLHAAIEKINAVVPFNPRMRGRVGNWQLAVRREHGLRSSRLTPLVPVERRSAVLGWMALLDDPIVEVPTGQVRVLMARLGAGKSEQALRWWNQGLEDAENDPNTDIPVFLAARHITTSLESAILSALGGDPARHCRVVIDDLDSVTLQEASRLLTEARQFVHVWPGVSVLATARPGVPVPDEEQILVKPWSTRRGAELVEVALGGDVSWHRWNAETTDLLSSPLTALGMAARIRAGRDMTVSRARLLSGLTEDVIGPKVGEVSEATWSNLARLAVRILGQSEPVTAASFGSLPQLRLLTGTDLVVEDRGELTFALPVFEQYFGSEALKRGLTRLDTVATATTFPRWRYAIAFAVSTAITKAQEALLTALAQLNPGAAFWVLDEIADANSDHTLDGPSHEAIAALIDRRDPTGELAAEPDLPVRAGRWLRGAEQALLIGLGPLAESLARHRDGRLVQWGVWLEHGYVTVARARDQLPPPEVIRLAEECPPLGQWHQWTQQRFPTSDLGRWLVARCALQKRLEATISKQTLPVPRTSWLARERLHSLAKFVRGYHDRAARRYPINLAELRGIVGSWMETVNTSDHATWRGTGGQVDSADIRWLSAQLAVQDGETLLQPWPDGDQPGTGRWFWEQYSPELTLAMAADVVREAIIGYRQLVESAFPAFGDALGLYSMLPVRVEGIVRQPVNDEGPYPVVMLLSLNPDLHAQRSDIPSVDLQLAPEDGQAFWAFGKDRESTYRTTFGQSSLQSMELPLDLERPATYLAYQWLTQDLAEIGWLKNYRHPRPY
ncbi:hypothetical protein [Umezawaea sp. Da 62-37]|uniref:hypothetical protein n=1 Tax=Umezawaea sp. Da 62-37 TaxID=3075927 RepID=UPI0028F6DCD3|nr:hypothetical protein [Umezawaea sp. Da 62-37]WNV82895.1 hypothetical protein RM788_32475 [Umezawaea sp. Da 62-37]